MSNSNKSRLERTDSNVSLFASMYLGEEEEQADQVIYKCNVIFPKTKASTNQKTVSFLTDSLRSRSANDVFRYTNTDDPPRVQHCTVVQLR